MPDNNANPRISFVLRAVTFVESGVLLVSGVGLFVLPALLSPLWPWALTPFNTRFLGAVYLASVVSTLALTAVGRWSPARVVLPTILTFTTIVLAVTLLSLDRFTVPLSTALWLILYMGIPLNAAAHLWLYRRLPHAPPVEISPSLRGLLLTQAVVLGAYGVALLVVPSLASGFWMWTLDEFHARMYSVAFITPAVGAFLVARSATRLDLLALGGTLLAGGALPILGVVVVNAAVNRVDWTQLGAWVWVALFASIALAGAWMLWEGRARRPLDE